MSNLVSLVRFFSVMGYYGQGFKRLSRTSEDVTGYQNPHEESYDIIQPLGRTQLIGNVHRWPKTGVLMLFPAKTYSPKQQCLLRVAVKILDTYSCIPIRILKITKKCANSDRIIPCILSKNDELNTSSKLKAMGIEPDRNTLKDFIFINKHERACSSILGRNGRKQIINFANKCFTPGVGSLVHEMLHALGYNHEHTRADRDSYISINTSNIIPNGLHNFGSGNQSRFQDYGPYDFESLMHYSAYAFAIDKQYRTIIPIDENASNKYYKIGQRKFLTTSDKAKIRAVTKCPGKLYEEHVKQVEQIERGNRYVNAKVLEDNCF